MSKRRLPSLNALRTLEAIEETGSISAAARSLFVSHSAVSHQIKSLQDWIGNPVITRKGRSIVLTPAGKSLAKVVNRSFDAIRHELDLIPLRIKRSITISALQGVAEQIIIPNLPKFLDKNPELSIHISVRHSDQSPVIAPDIEIDFKRRNLLQADDIVFLSGIAGPVASPSIIEKYGSAENALEQAPLLSDEDDRMWKTWREIHGVAQSQNQYPIAYFEGSQLMLRAAIEGLGISFARKALIRQELEKGQLQLLSELSIDSDWTYYIRKSPDAVSEPEVQRVVNWLLTLSSLQV